MKQYSSVKSLRERVGEQKERKSKVNHYSRCRLCRTVETTDSVSNRSRETMQRNTTHVAVSEVPITATVERSQEYKLEVYNTIQLYCQVTNSQGMECVMVPNTLMHTLTPVTYITTTKNYHSKNVKVVQRVGL